MKIGLIDVDSHNFPNLALMKISAYHKAQGDEVEWWWGWGQYDRVYMSKVFDETYSTDHPEPVNTKEIIKGGTGYGLENKLPDEIEHMYPDYSLYPELTKGKAYGFLTRGCPNNCPFCIVCAKEGRKSCKVADLDKWWNGQKNIILQDPNLLACRDHMDLLAQLADSKAWVDMNQGLDARMLTEANIDALNKVKIKRIHFAWVKEHIEAATELDAVEVVRCQNCVHAEPLDRNCELSTTHYLHCKLWRGDETKNVWHKYKKYYKDYSLVERDGYCDAGQRWTEGNVDG